LTASALHWASIENKFQGDKGDKLNWEYQGCAISHICSSEKCRCCSEHSQLCWITLSKHLPKTKEYPQEGCSGAKADLQGMQPRCTARHPLYRTSDFGTEINFTVLKNKNPHKTQIQWMHSKTQQPTPPVGWLACVYPTVTVLTRVATGRGNRVFGKLKV